ncbi:ATP-binding protein [Ferruginibacter yonginensis]|uniref:histidine kinase n=1 Tax=Ferruginibacter yonginensis TaxID=1310416 RepID=A0ABV8QU33_9BACT
MGIAIFKHKIVKDNIYLLLASLLLLSISIFTNRTQPAATINHDFAVALQKYINKQEQSFQTLLNDSTAFNNAVSWYKTIPESKATPKLFVYAKIGDEKQLRFWNTQTVLPTPTIINGADGNTFALLSNGYYFVQKQTLGSNIIIGLSLVQWQYSIPNNYLRNDFVIPHLSGASFQINENKDGANVTTSKGTYLFSVKNSNTNIQTQNNELTVWLRLLALIPLLIFIYFITNHILQHKNFLQATGFLIASLLGLRVLTYVLVDFFMWRYFELFDPTIYGAGFILRSLGDLLINALLFFVIINFIQNNLPKHPIKIVTTTVVQKWIALSIFTFLLLAITYFVSNTIRSMVADSQISFDVINFFSLDVYSVIGFLVLCFIAITYFFTCKVILFFIQQLSTINIQVFLLLVVQALILLSCMIGTLTDAFEFFELFWLLLFLLLLKIELTGSVSIERIISKLLFWLFFFSITISLVIISENGRKELNRRQHYAELIAAKANPINDVLLNTILTEFRADVMATKFYLLQNEQTAYKFRDSIIQNNIAGYNDTYDTKVLVYDALGKPLYNNDPILFNSIEGIFLAQSKPTAVEGLNYYDAGYDKLNYIAQKIIKDDNGNLMGYIFIVISPRNTNADVLYPELFTNGQINSIESSTTYAYAIYDKGKLIASHNDYAFTSRYQDQHFAGKQFLMLSNSNYNELWYNAGADKYVVIVKQNNQLIELITLFSYLFLSFLLLTAFVWLVALLLKTRFKLINFKKIIQLSIKHQIHGTIIFFSIISFLIIGIATILFFVNRYQTNNKETLSRTIKKMEEKLSGTVSFDMLQLNRFNSDHNNNSTALDTIATSIANLYGLDINIYDLNGDLKASSFVVPYKKGIASIKMNPTAYAHLHHKKEIQFYQQEHIGQLTYVSDYMPLTNQFGKDVGYLNIPYFTSQTKLKEEISNFLVTIINLNAFIFLIAGLVSLIITNRITNSFSFISEKMKSINLGKRNEIIEWHREDEIGALVKEYNKMLANLDKSAAALAKSERESAWQEMAKQVAHEIKNPLTPMKLSMQFLQNAIENGAPNIKELGAKVARTLVEQIDHLSQIAGEFSRFANIENANPEYFDLNEALTSIKQLYNGDSKVHFSWMILEQQVMVYADKTHVNRILTNLILNAIQAVPQGTTPQINVAETIIGSNVQIKITDNGIGISEAVQHKIFTPNFTTKTSGTGLGLAMCKRMVEQAGGSIYYQTSAMGTSFFVQLPIVTAV